MEQDKINKYSWYLFQIIVFFAFFFDSKFKVSVLIFTIQSIFCLLLIAWFNIRKYQYSLKLSALTELCYAIISLIYTYLVSTLILGSSKFHIEGFFGIIFVIVLNIPIIANVVLVYRSFNECTEYTNMDFEHTLITGRHKIVSLIIMLMEIIYVFWVLNGTRIGVIVIICLAVLLLLKIVIKVSNILKIISLCWLLLFPIAQLFICVSVFHEYLFSYVKDIEEEKLLCLLCIMPIHIMVSAFNVVNISHKTNKIS